jgi:hypothetical protein
MDKKFLNKVVDQLVSETRIYRYSNDDIKEIYPPFAPIFPIAINFNSYNNPFSKHCRDVYGLTHYEILYVWGEYISIITNKKNG